MQLVLVVPYDSLQATEQQIDRLQLVVHLKPMGRLICLQADAGDGKTNLMLPN